MKQKDWNQPQTHFGTLLKMQRDQWGVKQREVLAALPGWTQANYSRIEGGTVAPAFEHLLPIYIALSQAGVHWTGATREQFLTLARLRIAEKKTHWEHHSEEEWASLQRQLANVDHLPDEESGEPSDASSQTPSRPLLAETRHLLGREEWLSWITHLVHGTKPRKLLVLQGTMGVGKSSEMHRLARHFLQGRNQDTQVIWVPMLSAEHTGGPEAALSVLLGTMLTETGSPPAPSSASQSVHIGLALSSLERQTVPTLLFLDNAESLLNENGGLAPCWEHFLTRFLQSQHRGTLILATKEWPGWSGRESIFVAETTVPPLTTQASVQLLERLGLEGVPGEHLQVVSERVGGIPLCLEWVAALVHDPLLLDDWRSFGEEDDTDQHPLTERLLHLLEEPSLLRGHLATKLKPLLQRILEKRLSAEATEVLKSLAVSTIPLAKPAGQVLCPRPGLMKELRDVSLLVAYPNRIQLLPMVASAVLQLLSPEETYQREERLIEALESWLDDGQMSHQEAGAATTELTALLLKHHRLLDAAQILTQFDWMSFNQGHAPHLARIAEKVLQEFDWHTTRKDEYGGVLLNSMLLPFLGKKVDEKKQAEDYQRIHNALLTGEVALQSPTEGRVEHYLMNHALNELRFEDAQAIIDIYSNRLKAQDTPNLDLRVSQLEKRAWILGTWCEYNQEQKDWQAARIHREQAIALYEESIALILNNQELVSPRRRRFLKKRLARALNNLSYHLNRVSRFEEALQAIEQSILLKEQGFVKFDKLADAYGEKAEALAGLGRFQEALLFDEKAYAETRRLANAGYSSSKEELWIYCVNRGRLYLRLGRIDEAEHLLREALPHIHERRRMYRMFAKEALEEIEMWRRQAVSSQHQLDWRWVERYRTLASFDSYWWLAPAGPFTEEEQHEWEESFTSNLDETTKASLGTLMSRSTWREVRAAMDEHREPLLHYPALDIEEVRSRIAGLFQLDAEILRDEPNATVRRLYHDTIEEELDFLHLIEATYEGNTERFWECNLRLNPAPTHEEMHYALSRVRHFVLQGLLHSETKNASQRVIDCLSCFSYTFDLSYSEQEAEELERNIPLSSSPDGHIVSAQAARRFFEAVLQNSGYVEWQVFIDSNASGSRVEQGMRCLYLPDNSISVQQIKHYLSHELAGHVARGIAGERSLLGLLGIHTKHSLETEEGLATYYDRQMAKLLDQPYDETASWYGTLATGLASGVVTQPHTFHALFNFFEAFNFLYRLLKRLDQDAQSAQKIARRNAIRRCLRTFRGVPDLTKAGICYDKDALYLRGLWKIEQALAQDETVLDRLAVGVVALDRLPDLQELGIIHAPQPLRQLARNPDLDSYILSFEEPGDTST